MTPANLPALPEAIRDLIDAVVESAMDIGELDTDPYHHAPFQRAEKALETAIRELIAENERLESVIRKAYHKLTLDVKYTPLAELIEEARKRLAPDSVRIAAKQNAAKAAARAATEKPE